MASWPFHLEHSMPIESVRGHFALCGMMGAGKRGLHSRTEAPKRSSASLAASRSPLCLYASLVSAGGAANEGR